MMSKHRFKKTIIHSRLGSPAVIFTTLSVALHFFAVLLLNQTNFDTSKEEMVPQTIEWIETGRLSSNVIKESRPNRRKGENRQDKLNRRNARSLQFTQKFGITSPVQGLVEKGTRSRASYEENFDQDFNGTYKGLAQMNKIDISKLLKLNPSLKFLLAKIKAHLTYPDDLLKERLSGTVHIELNLQPNGQIKDIISTKGNQDLLTAYTLCLLFALFEKPLPESLHMEEDLHLSLQFIFKTNSIDPKTYLSARSYKNLFVFELQKFVEPKINEDIRTVITHYVPPVVPIPGGLYVDLYHLYHFIKNIGQPTEPQMRRKRLKQLKKQLRKTLNDAKK